MPANKNELQIHKNSNQILRKKQEHQRKNLSLFIKIL